MATYKDYIPDGQVEPKQPPKQRKKVKKDMTERSDKFYTKEYQAQMTERAWIRLFVIIVVTLIMCSMTYCSYKEHNITKRTDILQGSGCILIPGSIERAERVVCKDE